MMDCKTHCNHIVDKFMSNPKSYLDSNHKLNSTPMHACTPYHMMSAADTGASYNYYSPCNVPQGSTYLPHNPMMVILPNGKAINSQSTILVPEPKELPKEARTANVFQDLTEGSLTSIGQYCDHGCTVTFDKDHAHVYYNNRKILKGYRNHTNKLWYFDLNSKTKPTTVPTTIEKKNAKTNLANYIVPKTNSEKLTRFLHGACGSPCKQSLLNGLKENHLSTWPHLNTFNVKTHIRAPTATILGHMDHQRKNKLSTKIIRQSALEVDLDTRPKAINKKCNKVHVILYEESQRLYTDQTGKFPVKSARGYQYVLIAYVYDTNTILYRPLKSKTAEELQSTYDELYSYLTKRGCKPTFHRVDNELSHDTQQLLEQTFGAIVEIVPPQCHRRNAAERAIRTAKNHLIAILCATHDKFPLKLWCFLLEQAEITLNLLRTSRIHPHLSAYNSLCGAFNFSKTPLAPPGIKVIAHNNVSTRESWGPHGKIAYYVGPAMNHYRCYKVCVQSTKKIIVTDTIEYTEDNLFEIPYSSKEDELLDAVVDLHKILKDETPLTSHPMSPRQAAIAKLRQTILQPPPFPNTIPTSSPRVAPTESTLPRVGTPNTEEPPELEE